MKPQIASAENWVASSLVPNDEEYKKIVDFWKSDGDVDSWDAKLWLDITDKETEGSWTCSDGASFYENWRPGEPNNAAAGDGEDCAEISKYGGYKLEDTRCAKQLPFICQIEDIAVPHLRETLTVPRLL